MSTDLPADSKVMDALADAIKQAATPEVQQARNLILRRLAIGGDVAASRIPAPASITEIGGYLNLLTAMGDRDLRRRALASALGIALPEMQENALVQGPRLYLAERANDRPEGPEQPQIPLTFSLRSDFAAALDGVLDPLRRGGCQLPFAPQNHRLPGLGCARPTDADLMLAALGRTLRFHPSALRYQPASDPLVLALPETGNAWRIHAHSLDSQKAAAAEIQKATCRALGMGDAGAQVQLVEGYFVELETLLNAAGWYSTLNRTRSATSPSAAGVPAAAAGQPELAAAHALVWRNVTGLVRGETTLRDELTLLYTEAEIAGSGLREMASYVWDGTTFAPASA